MLPITKEKNWGPCRILIILGDMKQLPPIGQYYLHIHLPLPKTNFYLQQLFKMTHIPVVFPMTSDNSPNTQSLPHQRDISIKPLVNFIYPSGEENQTKNTSYKVFNYQTFQT